MSYKLAYIFETEAEAVAARDLIDEAMHLPISGGVTEHWVGYSAHGEKWVIMYSTELSGILGQPQVLPEWTDPEPADE